MQHGISTCLGTGAILGELGGESTHRKAKSTDSKDQIEMVLCTDIPLILKEYLFFLRWWGWVTRVRSLRWSAWSQDSGFSGGGLHEGPFVLQSNEHRC